MIPFQFSVHYPARDGSLGHRLFLELSSEDPSKAFAPALLAACGERGPVFVCNAGFEKARLSELAARFPQWMQPLSSISSRVVDLLPNSPGPLLSPCPAGELESQSGTADRDI